jgi:hypothetical protein
MSGKVIEVPLPGDAHATPEELETLQAAFRAILDVHYEGPHEWRNLADRLKAEGWELRLGLTWHAEARRGHDFEEACGRTRDEAFAELYQMTRLDVSEGCT